MSQFVVLNFGEGSCQQGFPSVVAQLGDNTNKTTTQRMGSLPPALELLELYQQWRSLYMALDKSRGSQPQLREASPLIEFEDDDVTQVSEAEFGEVSLQLKRSLNRWLDSGSFSRIERQLRTQLTPKEEIRILIETEDTQLRRLPWHLWNFFEDYPNAEVALSLPEYQQTHTLGETARGRVRVLAILGNSAGIDIQRDRRILEELPETEVIFLVEPQRPELNEWLWDNRGWDILFFAGHSSSHVNDTTGQIEINPTESISIEQLKQGLKAAIQRGLKLAIFNSCEGLGLARQLAGLQIPQLIVMREPVQDQVAQKFLTHFLPAFSQNQPFYLAVRQAREKLEGIEDKSPGASWLPVTFQNPATIPPTWEQLRDGISEPKTPTIPVSLPESFIHTGLTLAVTTVVIGIRLLGGLQPLELKAFDYLMRSRPDEGSDPRLLLITITGADVQAQPPQERQATSLSNHALDQVLQKVMAYQPRAIGLDIYREIPVKSEYQTLINTLKNNDRFITVCQVGEDANNPGVPTAAEIPKDRLRQQVGFGNSVFDPDNIIRRQLIGQAAPTYSKCSVDTSLNLRLALRYLADEGITDNITESGDVAIGDVVFPVVQSRSGGYQNIESRGYQFMLNYRATANIAPQLTLQEVLIENKLTPELVKDKIVLIGTVDKTFRDIHRTPYSRVSFADTPGVIIQAHKVSQILSAVQDRRPVIWWWSESLELLWIVFWSGLAGVINWRFKSLKIIVILLGVSLILLWGCCYLTLWITGGWIPFIPPAITLSLTAIVGWIYQSVKPEVNQ